MTSNIKRVREEPSSSYARKKNKFTFFPDKREAAAVLVDLIHLAGDNKGGSVHNVGPNSLSAALQPGQAYIVGRDNRDADIIFNDPRVSKQHCQLLFDGFFKKLYLLNGALLIPNSIVCVKCNYHSNDEYNNCLLNEFRSRLIGNDKVLDEKGDIISCCKYVYKGSLNGMFVNGVRVSEGLVVELGVGDEVLLVCGKKSRVCSDFKSRVGFIDQRIVLHEELVEPGFDGFRFDSQRLVRPLLCGQVNKRVFAFSTGDLRSPNFKCDEVVSRATSLSAYCNHIVGSYDPVSCIRWCMGTHSTTSCSYFCQRKEKKVLSIELNGDFKTLRKSVSQANAEFLKKLFNETLRVKDAECLRAAEVPSNNVAAARETLIPLEPIIDNLNPIRVSKAAFGTKCGNKATNYAVPKCLDERIKPINVVFGQKDGLKKISPPGMNFYLNRLDSMHECSSKQDKVVSLPELLHPVDTISRMFIATFTSDIGWFLSDCDIPSHLPVTIACHNAEKCWSADPGKRTCVPDPDFPNLTVV